MTVYPGGAFTTTQPWFNTVDYTVPQLVIFALGSVGWVIAYVATTIALVKKKFVEIPAGAVVANMAWEVVWGFIYGCDTGRAFTYGYALWAIQDLFITWGLFKYGSKQVSSEYLKGWFKRACAFGIIAWFFAFYFFVGEGYDNRYGAISGYIINVMMSALYIDMVLPARHRPVLNARGVEQGAGHRRIQRVQCDAASEDTSSMALCLITARSTPSTSCCSYRLRARKTLRSAAASAPAAA